MKFGIPNTGFERLIARLKEAIEYTDDWEESWEEEYGEDWGEESYAAPEEEAIEVPHLGGSLSKEDFIKGELILAGMGYDIENMSEDDIASILVGNPEYLELNPQFDVQGQWVHTLREVMTDKIPHDIAAIMQSDTEICVTAGEASEFWNFSGYRMVAIVLEGVCKVLWNADMYSAIKGGETQLTRTRDSSLEFINEMTEGWLVPSECKLVGLKVNWDNLSKHNNEVVMNYKQQMDEIAAQFGIPIVANEDQQKMLVGIDTLSAEEAADYGTCAVDFESPEHLLEEPTEPEYSWSYSTYQEVYNEQLEDAIDARDIDKIRELLSMNAELHPHDFASASFKENLANLDLSYEEFVQLVKPVLNNEYTYMDDIFVSVLDARNWTMLEYMFEAGYNVENILFNITHQLFSPDLPNLIFKYILEPYKSQDHASSILLGAPENADPEKMRILVEEFGAWLDLSQLYSMNAFNKNHILKAIVDGYGYSELERYLDEERKTHAERPETLEAIDDIDETLYKLSVV